MIAFANAACPKCGVPCLIPAAGGTGRYICGLDIQTTESHTGKTTATLEPTMEFDMEEGDPDAGEVNIIKGLI